MSISHKSHKVYYFLPIHSTTFIRRLCPVLHLDLSHFIRDKLQYYTRAKVALFLEQTLICNPGQVFP